MAYNISNFTNDSRSIVNQMGNFSVLQYDKDISVAPNNATAEYFMSKMNVKKKQVVCNLNGNNKAVLQAGAMQYMVGNVNVSTGVKGVGDFLGKALKGAVTKESGVKPEYEGTGLLVLEPTYKYILLQDVSQWPGGMVVEDGMFLACDGTVKHTISKRENVSSALLGNEGLFNLCLSGNGTAVLESNVPAEELIAIDLQNDTLKIDGSMAVCWSAGLQFTVERTTKRLIGSAVSGEGLVNVYRGTGRVLMAPVTPSYSLYSATQPSGSSAVKNGGKAVSGVLDLAGSIIDNL